MPDKYTPQSDEELSRLADDKYGEEGLTWENMSSIQKTAAVFVGARRACRYHPEPVRPADDPRGQRPGPTSAPNPNALRIVAGSGFSSFEPILKRWGQQNGVDVQVTYKGSLDIMLMLEAGSINADAIWEGDSLWTSLGDKNHLVKDSKSIMCSPIVFGVKRSIAQELGWVERQAGGGSVRMQEILDAAEARRLRVLMTSASQSNSGASAYFGFLYAFAGQPDVLTADNLADPAVGDKVKRTLARVDRTSESSGWMRDYFVNNYAHYDGMFNYESHILEMNQKLAEKGEEPVYIVYPAEGLGIADFPFSFVSKDNARQGAPGGATPGLPAVRAGAAGDRGQGPPGRPVVRPGGPEHLPLGVGG